MNSILSKNAVKVQKSNVVSTRVFQRGMATEKQILMRINGTTNIAKITKSMKMVSAAKMRGAQNRLTAGRPFGDFLARVGDKPVVVETDGLVPQERHGKDNTVIVITSDRGLCGGCNSYVAKATRRQMAELVDKSDIFVIGEKGRSQLRRTNGTSIAASVTDCWSTVPSFAMASSIAESILSTNPTMDKAHIVFNRFMSAISYLPSIRTVNMQASLATENSPDPLISYEVEPDNRSEFYQDLAEFQLAAGVFTGMIEANTSEESSRMAAMENATNNAQDLISALTLQYNKARQARITTELVEIISGAASLDG